MGQPIWIVRRGDYSEYIIISILRFLLSEFERIFGEEAMKREPCVVYNDPQAGCPMLVINSSPVKIQLALSSLSSWSQMIFQLSHELCHYAMRQCKDNKDFTLSWFEEICCEAMSLYALHWAADHWDRCELYSKDPGYGVKNRIYLNKELNKSGTGGFQACTSINLMMAYSPCENRESHRDERNALYYEIVKDPLLFRCICDYQKYLDSNKITINFEKWERNDANPMIRFLHSLQPYKKVILIEKEGP